MSSIKKEKVQTRISLPTNLTPEQRELAGKKIVQLVKERTKHGVSAKSKPFPKYSKEYKESLDFKIAGKSSTVNLSQTGDMIADLDMLQHGRGYVLIGYSMDYEDIGKVHGNVTGEYGQEFSTGKKRDFIGLPERLVRVIVEEAKNELPTLQEEKESIIGNILSRFNGNNSGE